MEWLWLKTGRDSTHDRRSHLIFFLVISLLLLNSTFVVILLCIDQNLLSKLTPAWFSLFFTIFSAILVRKKKIELAGFILVGSLWVLQTIMIVPDGVLTASFHSYLFVFVLAGIFFGTKVMIAILGITIIVVQMLVHSQINGYLPLPQNPVPNLLLETFIRSAILTINTVITAFAINYLEREKEQVNREFIERINTQKNLEKSQLNLREKDRQLVGITNNLPGVIFQFFITPEGHYDLSFVGRQSRDMFGMEPDLNGYFERFSAHLHVDDKQTFFHSIRDAVETGSQWFYEGRFIHDNGKTIWFRGFATPDPENKSTFNGIVLDITENKALEEQIEYRQEQVSSFIENPSVAIMIADETGKILQANSPYAKLFELEPQDMLGKDIWDFTYALVSPELRTPELIDRIKEIFHKIMGTGKVDTSRRDVFETVTPSGRRIFIQQNMFVFNTSQGKCLGAFLVDQTELEKTKKEREDSEKSYRALFEQGPFEISVSRMTGEIMDVNNQYCLAVGLPRDEIIGKTAKQLDRLTDENEIELRKLVEKTGGTIDQYEMPMNCGGHPRIVLLSAKVITVQNEPLVFTIITDITSRKKSEMKVELQLQQMTGLREIDTSIISGEDIEDTLNKILDQGVYWLKAQTTCMNLGIASGDHKSQTFLRGKELINKRFLDEDTTEIRNFTRERNSVIVNEEDFSRLPKKMKEFYETNQIRSHFRVPIVVGNWTRGIFDIFLSEPLQEDASDWILYAETLAGQAALAITNHDLISGLQEKNDELLEAYEGTIFGLGHALEIRDKETFGHSERVLELSLKVAEVLHFTDEEISNFRRGVLLHDIGKIGIPDSILLKPGPLDEDEWKVMRLHPVYAYELLKGVSFLKNALDVPYSHHERWDGSGYPQGLTGEGIPVSARIFSVVDVWDALTNDRPYRKAWTSEEASQYLTDNAGVQFDPKIVEIFLSILSSV